MSDFRKEVIKAVRKVPRGEVITYKEVAALAGKPSAARAVGNILSTNCDPMVPCHRVVRADGQVGGYNKGKRRKLLLLKKEGVNYEEK